MPDDLEHELHAMHPIGPSPTCEAAIARALAHSQLPSRSLSDRILLITLSTAAAAALLIVTLLATDYANAPSSPSSTELASTTTPPRCSRTSNAFSRNSPTTPTSAIHV